MVAACAAVALFAGGFFAVAYYVVQSISRLVRRSFRIENCVLKNGHFDERGDFVG